MTCVWTPCTVVAAEARVVGSGEAVAAARVVGSGEAAGARVVGSGQEGKIGQFKIKLQKF